VRVEDLKQAVELPIRTRVAAEEEGDIWAS